MKKVFCVVCSMYRKFKNREIYIFIKKHYFFLLIAYENDNEKIFKEKESIEILKLLGLIKNT